MNKHIFVRTLILFSFVNLLLSCETKPKIIKIYQMKEYVTIGYMTYLVGDAFWADKIKHEKPDAKFLVIAISVMNNDKEPRTIPPFYLYDDYGAKYEVSSKAISIEGTIGLIKSLNPNVAIAGLIVFDVPKKVKYKLKVSGGYWSTEEAYIELNEIKDSWDSEIKAKGKKR